ncbi:MAG TPA: Type 1 glutamine amidotransferase-like domain-containing protein [Candidatus Paceibacterota bacterium]|nr:Type 1 glutamine amidotransferase-like domain-containing protein [Candidatus Paceibacterota bacterium]HMO83027.1 Type 1 glutamine amidotransferase-like domain-containing protein [Candidatus Paceibacterota bacterium]
MKTKFILHGGFNPGQTNEDNSDFYKEILRDAPEGSRILLVPFAKDTHRIPSATEKVAFEFNKQNKNITVEVADEQNFIQQLKFADIAYFHGGASLKLLEALKKYLNLEDSLCGKIIAGESAGANVWSKFFYSPKADVVSEGLGILPIKMIPHYKKEYAGRLDKVGPDLEPLLLFEYHFKVFYK